MEINLKDNIWIKGFNSYEDYIDILYCDSDDYNKKLESAIYYGKTLEIPEEIGKKCVDILPPIANFGDWCFKNYSNKEKFCTHPKESIQSACDYEYCIIYKK